MATPSPRERRTSRWTRQLLTQALPTIEPTVDEVADARAGDELVPVPDVIMDRAFTVAGVPREVWPWLVQLGKGRAGWYLPRRVERFVPSSRRALRRVDERWQSLDIGDVVPDYGGADATFTAELIEPAEHLVYSSRRGRMDISWSLTLRPTGGSTRVLLRLRLAPVRRTWLADTLGELVDALTIAGLAAGLRERLAPPDQNA